MSYYPQFGDLLNQELLRVDRPPAWLARQLGINGSTVSRWLNEGARPGSPELVVQIAGILGIDTQRQSLLVAAGYGYPGVVTELVVEAQTTPAAPLLNTLSTRSNLPQPFTPFVGRVTEVAQLTQQLLNPSCRLLTLSGPGGIGKSRLAIEVARHLLVTDQAFADGAIFVSLIELNAPEQIDAAIATVLGLTLQSEQAARNHLQDYLRNKQLLLLLDNFEHLQAGAEGISRLLDDAPQVKILVTSRAALGVLGEWFYPVDGLKAPEEGVKPEDLSRYDSVQLFQQCAQQAFPAFDLDGEARHVARICRLVEGMPLAIELAAAWLRLLPCARVAQAFEHNLAALASPLPNMPPRHRSMHFVLSHSWQMLTVHEAAVLEVLAIFQGGFDDVAAIEVAETDLFTLAALAQKSMIRLKQEPSTLPTGRARYLMHEMLRQFVAEQAAQRPQTRSASRTRHSRYYLRWLHQQTPHLVNAGQYEAMALIEEDFDNVRAAWLWAVEQQDYSSLTLAVEGLFHFCHIRVRVLDGVPLLKRCIEQLQAKGVLTLDAEERHLLGMLLARTGGLYADSNNPGEAFPLMEQSFEYLDDPRTRAFALGRFGSCHIYHGNLALAEALVIESLTLSREYDDLLVQAYDLFKLARIAHKKGDALGTLAFYQECLAVFRALGRPSGIAHTLCDVGWMEYRLGDYEAATAHVLESLPISRRLGFHQGEALAFTCLGQIAAAKGEVDEAVAYMQKALAIDQSTGAAANIAYSLGNMAEIFNDCGMSQQALQYGFECVALARTLENKELHHFSLRTLGYVQSHNGDFGAARSSLMEALPLAWSNNDRDALLRNLYAQADLLVEESRFQAANEAVGARCQALEWLVFLQHHPACWQVFKDKAAQLVAEIAATLPADQVAAAQERGMALTLDEAVQPLLEQGYYGTLSP